MQKETPGTYSNGKPGNVCLREVPMCVMIWSISSDWASVEFTTYVLLSTVNDIWWERKIHKLVQYNFISKQYLKTKSRWKWMVWDFYLTKGGYMYAIFATPTSANARVTQFTLKKTHQRNMRVTGTSISKKYRSEPSRGLSSQIADAWLAIWWRMRLLTFSIQSNVLNTY